MQTSAIKQVTKQAQQRGLTSFVVTLTTLLSFALTSLMSRALATLTSKIVSRTNLFCARFISGGQSFNLPQHQLYTNYRFNTIRGFATLVASG